MCSGEGGVGFGQEPGRSLAPHTVLDATTEFCKLRLTYPSRGSRRKGTENRPLPFSLVSTERKPLAQICVPTN